MSNVTLVVLSIIVAAFGGGVTVLAWALFKENSQLKEKLAIAQDNHRRNSQIAREYQVLADKLEEERDDLHLHCHLLQQELKMAEEEIQRLRTSSANGWKDAGEKWAQLLQSKEEMNDLKEKVETLEAWIASPPATPTSKPAFSPANEDIIW